MIFRCAAAIQSGTVRQQIFEGPVIAECPEQIIVRMRMGIDEAGEHDVVRGVQLLGPGWRGELATDGDDLVAIDEHVGRF
jgi:hypothetical protein